MALVSPEKVYLLKLSTLPKSALEKICKNFGLPCKGKIPDLINQISLAKIDEKKIDSFIKVEYQAKRNKERYSLGITHEVIIREVEKVKSHIWVVIQGELDSHIQKNYVRKYFRLSDLLKAVDESLSSEVKSYVLCTWYNHWTSEILEDIIAEHTKVIPTVKKVRDVDIFWQQQPWDVKNTNLPKEWFKEGYTIEDAVKNPALAAKYLYELQGQQRFGDNNRIFLIIADTKNKANSWKLKRDFKLIKQKVDTFFNQKKGFDTVHFVYKNKAYIAHSKILFIIK